MTSNFLDVKNCIFKIKLAKKEFLDKLKKDIKILILWMMII